MCLEISFEFVGEINIQHSGRNSEYFLTSQLSHINAEEENKIKKLLPVIGSLHWQETWVMM